MELFLGKPSAQSSAEDNLPIIPVGSAVLIYGFIGNRDSRWNGHRGRVHKYDQESGEYLVHCAKADNYEVRLLFPNIILESLAWKV
jgi:hypothetical protein